MTLLAATNLHNYMEDMHMCFGAMVPKRISYSTSHAATLAAIGHEAATLVSVRLSEMLHKSDSPTLHQLAAVQEVGNPQLPIDDYGDCNDVY